eukprot:gnl/MRDRNA2_/MRDRNA2_67488_c0_seq1.p1 gnl/MRDRNA2_/MRDRNA2_67488_c0~~gnl/MRDRNA2_/MRDRNA2_67488_c0_seq1.p1  ORF type:complete len:907 (+),score=69.90 gnl/MRDRNA2_/MRDRNA2_67488_c0_seq1:371-2722(+)
MAQHGELTRLYQSHGTDCARMYGNYTRSDYADSYNMVFEPKYVVLCFKDGLCSRRVIHDNCCSRLSESIFNTFYKPCEELARNIESNLHWKACVIDHGTSLCDFFLSQKSEARQPRPQIKSSISRILCTPRISPNGGQSCECINPFNTTHQSPFGTYYLNKTSSVQEKFAFSPIVSVEIPKYETAPFQTVDWICEQTDGGSSICKPKTSANCSIAWYEDPVASQQQYHTELKLHYRSNMWLGTLKVPHGLDGEDCSKALNANVECLGFMCAQIMQPTSDRAPQEAIEKCRSVSQALSEPRSAFGCAADNSILCLATSLESGSEQCSCVDTSLHCLNKSSSSFHIQSVTSNTDTSNHAEWQCRKLSGSSISSQFDTSDVFCNDNFLCQQLSNDDCWVEWSDWQCQVHRNNGRNRTGTLTKRHGLNGKNCSAQFERNGTVSCGWRACAQESWRHEFREECDPKRQITDSGCRCEIDWPRIHGSPQFEKCGKEFAGCCNSGGNSNLGSSASLCSIGSDREVWPQPDTCKATKNFDECQPVSKKRGVCQPWWHLHENSTCPYGTALTGDVTLPQTETWSRGVAVYVSVFYGYIPYLVALAVFLEFICTRRTRALSFLAFVLISCLLGEVFFKRLVRQPRPEFTCLHSCGMPSSHSTLAIGYFTMTLIDGMTQPRARDEDEGSDIDERVHCGRVLSAVPLIDSGGRNHNFLAWVGLWFFLLVPVPVTRVLLGDHTPSQVLCGSFIGMGEAVCCFKASKWWERRKRESNDSLGNKHRLSEDGIELPALS